MLPQDGKFWLALSVLLCSMPRCNGILGLLDSTHGATHCPDKNKGGCGWQIWAQCDDPKRILTRPVWISSSMAAISAASASPELPS